MKNNGEKQSPKNSPETFNWTAEEVEKVVVRDFNAAITTFHTILSDRELLVVIVDRLMANLTRQREAMEAQMGEDKVEQN